MSRRDSSDLRQRASDSSSRPTPVIVKSTFWRLGSSMSRKSAQMWYSQGRETPSMTSSIVRTTSRGGPGTAAEERTGEANAQAPLWDCSTTFEESTRRISAAQCRHVSEQGASEDSKDGYPGTCAPPTLPTCHHSPGRGESSSRSMDHRRMHEWALHLGTRETMKAENKPSPMASVFELGHTSLNLVRTLNLRFPHIDASHHISRSDLLLEATPQETVQVAKIARDESGRKMSGLGGVVDKEDEERGSANVASLLDTAQTTARQPLDDAPRDIPPDEALEGLDEDERDAFLLADGEVRLKERVWVEMSRGQSSLGEQKADMDADLRTLDVDKCEGSVEEGGGAVGAGALGRADDGEDAEYGYADADAGEYGEWDACE
ncbi:hypothetical protein PHLGIDRAFT_14106 [Phlebiopsis gigantea 11061_1 CR5-6]|uniref:Uncharacterized protein n=1 Tax=Phlebiopsis gigantea (strain 11061_1 CR5-6) TaxID=745531 RepID=A0A0C3NLY1_PHLG1|nr:hypothetical protein PHLGIDRAFT_14106 [Phlebiopsis gigantea 11061_1 CR5-6]